MDRNDNLAPRDGTPPFLVATGLPDQLEPMLFEDPDHLVRCESGCPALTQS